jgi:hypothetical protein
VCKGYQLERYREFRKEHAADKFFLVVGLDGTASAPKNMYCAPLEKIKYANVFLGSLEEYRRPADKAFWFTDGNLK